MKAKATPKNVPAKKVSADLNHESYSSYVLQTLGLEKDESDAGDVWAEHAAEIDAFLSEKTDF